MRPKCQEVKEKAPSRSIGTGLFGLNSIDEICLH